MYVRKEAVLSSQIEGTQSSLQDVLAAEAKVLSPNRPQDVDEVVNYVRAMNHGLERLSHLPVSIRLIREIHAELLAGVRGSHLTPGELRTSQNWIGPGGCTLNEATFVPPPPHEVAAHLSQLEQFLHSDSGLPLLVKIGLAHAQFETIHPFLDGNGRVGRLLITFLLCEQKVLEKPVLYLSYYFKRHRQEYYDQLQAVRDKGAWEDWIEFFLRGKRADTVLFIDARHIYRQVDRAHRDWTPAQIGFIANLVRLYRGEPLDLTVGGDETAAKLKDLFGKQPAYKDVPGLCKSATITAIEAQGWSLNPGRYVGVAPGEEVSDEDFKTQLETLNEELERLNAQARELEQIIAANVAGILGA